MSGTILIADENRELTTDLAFYLKNDGFSVSCVQDGKSAIDQALNHVFDAIILEILLPELNGFEVLKAIRKQSTIPALILTTRVDDIDQLVAFEVGADEYITKPCNPHELIARLRALLRRTQNDLINPSCIQYHHINVDCARRVVLVAGNELELTNTEFNILEKFIKSPGYAFSKEELTKYAMGRKYTAYDRSIDVHISNLRHKLGEHPEGGEWIKTLRGFGYLFNI